MRARVAVGLAVGVLLLLSVAACSARTDEDALVGRWVQSSTVVDASEVSISQEYAPTVEFRDDGTADYFGGEVRWSVTNDVLTLTVGSSGSLQTSLPMHYELSGDRLVIDSTVFERE